MCLFEQIKLLHDNGLHSNLISLGNLVLTMAENRPECLNPVSRYQTLVYIGQSLQSQGEHRRAEATFKEALQYAKAATKTKAAKTADLFKEGVTEIDVKYAMAECNIAVRQFSQALTLLESIPQRHRTPKVNMGLGRLYQQAGMERPAITAYKEVLKECPLALEAVQELLSLGVRGAEVASLMINMHGNSSATEWLSLWVKGHAYLHGRDYTSAINAFRQLEETSVLSRNVDILATLGETYYLAGDAKNALSMLQRANAVDHLNLRGTDLLACLLAGEKRNRELEELAMAATSVTDSAPQPWIIMGYYCQLSKRTTKAIYFAHKACSINPRSVEGLLLKGTLLLELKKLQEAVMHFREAMQIAPHRFEPHKGLVDCYLAMHRSREAVTIASNACKLLGQTPRALTLYASVLLKDTLTVSKGKSLLEKALKEDPYYLPAVYLLCEIYEQDMRYDAAIELLRKQVAVQSTCRLHQMLADFFSHVRDEEKAAHHFGIALNHEPGNTRALEGMQKMEAAPDTVEAPPYDMEVEDIADSERFLNFTREEEDFAARHSDVSDCVLLSDWFKNLSEANTAGKRTTNMPRKLRSTSSGDKPSVVRKHDDPTSTSQEAGGAPSSRSYSSEPGPSTSRQTDAARLRRGCQTRSFLDLLDESDFSESDDDWLPEAVMSSGRLIGVEEAVTSSDSDSEEDLQEISVSSTAGEPRRLFYLRNKSFVDHAPQNATENLGACNLLKPIEYFLSYVSEDFLGDIAMYTNMKSIETTGACINTNSKEIATFIGMTFAMSIIKMPRIRMYWQSKTRIPWIADKMARDRFFRLRHSLKVINDNTVLEDNKKSDRLWKVRPLLEAVRTRCSELPRPSKVSIDESMIPFRGRIGIRQHVPGKPFPDGLKMFVLASPSGMVLDFEIFQTKEALLSIVEKLNVKPDRTLTTGEAAVLRFVRSVDAGTSIFFDRYFTSSNLLCDLYDRGLRGTGTIKKNMVPKEAKQKLKTEATLRKEGRGASDCQVRNDNKVAVTAWYDKKLVLMASNEFSIDDEDICQRWSKATNTHVGVKRPRVVREYNSAMGGVDVHDQIVSYYRSPNRTKKWTVRVVLHLLDVVTANCWLEYRKDMESKPKQYLDFKLILADQLMSGDFFDHATDSQSISDASLSSVDCIDSETEPPPKAAKQGLTPLPNRAERKKGASHLPIVIDGKNSFRRCRREGCKNRTRTLCSQCNVFLCNYAKRNCFFEFHV